LPEASHVWHRPGNTSPLDIGLAVPSRPIGPWSRRTGAPEASATLRDRELNRGRVEVTRHLVARTRLLRPVLFFEFRSLPLVPSPSAQIGKCLDLPTDPVHQKTEEEDCQCG
jgi:hypothetical protein